MLDAQPICQVCGIHLSTQVDHIEANDDHSFSNLQGICEPCHTRKTQAEAAAARGAHLTD